MSPVAARKARLYGVSIQEVAAFCRGISRPENPAIAWEAFPEVHVKCPDREALEAVLDRFPDAVYGLDELTFEEAVVRGLLAAGWTLATAESCTGGLIASMVTAVPGSSGTFLGGVVAYSNAVKAGLLEVPGDLLEAHGAVSGPVVEAMATGARRRMGSDLAVAVSGVAGPGGGTPEKPVGTVWVAWEGPGETRESRRLALSGDRERIRRVAAYEALEGLRRRCLVQGAGSARRGG